jgi:hypothetical protein
MAQLLKSKFVLLLLLLLLKLKLEFVLHILAADLPALERALELLL